MDRYHQNGLYPLGPVAISSTVSEISNPVATFKIILSQYVKCIYITWRTCLFQMKSQTIMLCMIRIKYYHLYILEVFLKFSSTSNKKGFLHVLKNVIGIESNKYILGCYLSDKKALNNWQWNTFCKSKYTTYTRSVCRFVFLTFWRNKEIIMRRYQMRNDCTNKYVSEACHIITITSLNVVLLTGISS